MVEDAAERPVRVAGFRLGNHWGSIWVYWTVEVSSTESKPGSKILNIINNNEIRVMSDLGTNDSYGTLMNQSNSLKLINGLDQTH